MQISGFALVTTTCGVIPQAQKTGTSPSSMTGGSPYSGFMMSAMPMAAGSPKCTGEPWVSGKRLVTSTARIASAGLKGRIEHTIPPSKGPDFVVAILVS